MTSKLRRLSSRLNTWLRTHLSAAQSTAAPTATPTAPAREEAQAPAGAAPAPEAGDTLYLALKRRSDHRGVTLALTETAELQGARQALVFDGAWTAWSGDLYLETPGQVEQACAEFAGLRATSVARPKRDNAQERAADSKESAAAGLWTYRSGPAEPAPEPAAFEVDSLVLAWLGGAPLPAGLALFASGPRAPQWQRVRVQVLRRGQPHTGTLRKLPFNLLNLEWCADGGLLRGSGTGRFITSNLAELIRQSRAQLLRPSLELTYREEEQDYTVQLYVGTWPREAEQKQTENIHRTLH